jgi:hypothetical protein
LCTAPRTGIAAGRQSNLRLTTWLILL